MNTADFVHTTHAGNLLRKRRRRMYGWAAAIVIAVCFVLTWVVVERLV